jgi:uncharacterized protein
LDRQRRLVVDTNIIVSGLITTGTPPALILDAIREKLVILLISDEVVSKYLRVLEYPRIRRYKKITDEAIGHLTALFVNEAERIEILSETIGSPDPDDDKFLSLAVEGGADLIVTGDKADLLSIKEVKGIQIVTARKAIEKLKLKP